MRDLLKNLSLFAKRWLTRPQGEGLMVEGSIKGFTTKGAA